MVNQEYIKVSAICGASFLLIFAIIISIIYFVVWSSNPSPHYDCTYCLENLNNQANSKVSKEGANHSTWLYCCKAYYNLFCCDTSHPNCCPNFYSYYPTNLCCNDVYDISCPLSFDYDNCVLPSKGDLNPYIYAHEIFQNITEIDS